MQWPSHPEKLLTHHLHFGMSNIEVGTPTRIRTSEAFVHHNILKFMPVLAQPDSNQEHQMIRTGSLHSQTRIIPLHIRAPAGQSEWHLSEQLQASRQHGVHAPHTREVQRRCQLLLAHAQAQQVARWHVPLQDLLEQIVQRLHSADGTNAQSAFM